MLKFTNEPDSVFKGRDFLRDNSAPLMITSRTPLFTLAHSVLFNSFLEFSIQRSCLRYFVEKVFSPFLVSFVFWARTFHMPILFSLLEVTQSTIAQLSPGMAENTHVVA